MAGCWYVLSVMVLVVCATVVMQPSLSPRQTAAPVRAAAVSWCMRQCRMIAGKMGISALLYGARARVVGRNM